jgi:nucleoside 2-deoxyribosyltransferase
MNYSITQCPLTGEPFADGVQDHQLTFYYAIKINDETYLIDLCKKCCRNHIDTKSFAPYRPIVRSLLLNGKMSGLGGDTVHWAKDEYNSHDRRFFIKDFLDQAMYPKTALEKFQNLFKELYKLQEYEGQQIKIQEKIINSDIWKKWYFNNTEELEFYLNSLETENIISITHPDFLGKSYDYKFTFNGLNEYLKLFTEGFNSKNCFIAMSFNKERLPILNAITNAVNKTGFNPIVINNIHNPSDKTIVDQIIANLRQSKFVIADFCDHKNGVYFEAGFAVGQGKSVIYTCSNDEFKNSHFDLKILQHILYDTPDELEKALINKIEAWIK